MTKCPLARAFRTSKTNLLVLSLVFFVSSAVAQTQPDKQTPSCTEHGYLRIAVYPAGKDAPAAVAFVVADPEGRRIGYDPIRKTEYADVPQATYVGARETSADPATQEAAAKPNSAEQYVEICNPIGGQYELRVIGNKPGKYTVSVSAASREFVDSSDKLMSLDSRTEIPATLTRRGTTQSFFVVYSRTPGVRVRVKPAQQK